MLKTLTPEQSRLLKALYAAKLPTPFRSVDVVHLIAGLGFRENMELGAALVDCIGKAISKSKLGRYLAPMCDIEDSGLMLERDLRKRTTTYLYVIVNTAARRAVAEMPVDPIQANEDYLRMEKAFASPPAVAARILQPILTRKAREERRQAEATARAEEVAINAANRAADRAAAKEQAEADKGRIFVYSSTTHRYEDGERYLDRVGIPGRLISAGGDPERFTLRWDIGSEFATAHVAYTELKATARQHQVDIDHDSIPLEVVLGRTIPHGASRDPRDYIDYSGRAAMRNFSTTGIENARLYAQRGKWDPFAV